MDWDPSLSKLRDALAGLYPTEAAARRVATSAGLDREPIACADEAVNA
jgi:hypothetical protein